MNRKELANALTDLDDRYIVVARQPVPSWRTARLATAAAVLALIFLWTSWSRPSVVARFQGQIITAALDIGDLSGLPRPTQYGPRGLPGLTLPLQLELGQSQEIHVQNGSLTIQDESGPILIEEGAMHEVKSSVEIYWTLDPAESGPFRLILEGSGISHEIELTKTVQGTWQLSLRP